MTTEIIIGEQKFNTTCPSECPGKEAPYMQGGLCHRCPIFNCVPKGDDGFCMLNADQYRPDWALVWKEWFDMGMKGYPALPLRKE